MTLVSPPAGLKNVVAAGNRYSVECAQQLLRHGGNAVDAAIAAVFVSFVAEPVLTSPFGGGFAVVGGTIPPRAYDFFAKIPGIGLGPIGHQLDFMGIDLSFGPTTQRFHVGRGATAVSLQIPGLLRLHRDHGNLPLKMVILPAIELARNGALISSALLPIVKILEPILRLTTESERLFTSNGRLLTKDDLFRSPDLAHLFELIVAGELDMIYRRLLTTFGPPHGRLTAADFDSLTIPVNQPLTIKLGDWDLALNPPSSCGGLLVAFGLNLLARHDDIDWNDSSEAYRAFFAAIATTALARQTGIDPFSADGGEGLQSQIKAFLSSDHVASWDKSFLSFRAHGLSDGPREMATPGNTTHVSVIDRHGLGCSITTSNGESCGWVVPGFGCLANNFCGEDDLHPHGFHRQPVGTRLISMMAPILALKDGRAVLALGAGGSKRIRSGLLQVIGHYLFRNLPIDQAVDAPRIHVDDGCLFLEERGPCATMPLETKRQLLSRSKRHVAFAEPNMFFGAVHAVTSTHGAGDPRRGGVSAADG